MNTNDKRNNIIKEALKASYKEIEPPDSWQSLRDRIDRRIDSEKFVFISPGEALKGIVFWRRLAFGMAACFLLTAGLLIYFLGFNYGVQRYQQREPAAANNLLGQAEMNRLNFAFSQVRQLFGQQAQWIMIGSGNSTRMGVADKIVSGVDNSKLIVVRLALGIDSEASPQRYFDIVTFSEQQVDFQISLANALPIDVSLKPTLKNDGRIELEINAQSNGRARANIVSTVVDTEFTPLVRMRANGNWVSIDGIGRSTADFSKG